MATHTQIARKRKRRACYSAQENAQRHPGDILGWAIGRRGAAAGAGRRVLARTGQEQAQAEPFEFATSGSLVRASMAMAGCPLAMAAISVQVWSWA